MVKQKKLFIIILVLVIAIFFMKPIFATDNGDLEAEEEGLTEEFKEYLKLPEKEREKVLMPRSYEIKRTGSGTKNFFKMVQLLNAGITDKKYSLKDIIPENMVVKNQGKAGTCWDFSALSALETTLALQDYKEKNKARVYDFSEKHMAYAVSRNFLNGEINPYGQKKDLEGGGTWELARNYLTNGMGAVSERDMPYSDSTEQIELREIDKKLVDTVYDTAEFPKYTASDDITEIKTKIKEHLISHGSLYISIHMPDSKSEYMNKEKGAIYCDDSTKAVNHAVSIIGWDDDYNKENFNEAKRPQNNGAWIVKNSWGEDSGVNGFWYISYEDVKMYQNVNGVEKATNKLNYKKIYQYDELLAAYSISFASSKVYLANIFDKKTASTEYLTQVAITLPEACTCKVYVNNKGTGKSEQDLKLITLKAGKSETFTEAGYHTLEFAEPLEIDSDQFVVAVEMQGTRENKLSVLKESKVEDTEYAEAKIEEGKCFVTKNLSENNWIDLSKISQVYSDIRDGDSTIKAFTVLKKDDNSLNRIEITKNPSKTIYYEGADFNKEGMIVRAYYNDGTEKMLDDSEYEISNGTKLAREQKTVSISYGGKIVELPVTVLENGISSIKVTASSSKTNYKPGENFDKTGMVVTATYLNGEKENVTDYTIERGVNLRNRQTSVIIIYKNKTTTQKITMENFELKDLSIANEPNKLEYIEGQNFDPTGMSIKAIYGKEDSTENDYEMEITDYTVSGVEKLNKETKQVTIKFEGKEVAQDISVIEKTIEKIEVSKTPTKLEYIKNKENLDLTGGKIKIIYNDESTEEIDMTNQQIIATGFSNSETGEIEITLTYLTKTTSFNVKVIDEVVAQNSDMSAAQVKVKNFNKKDEKIVIDVEVNNINRNLKNDSVEYYYYLSTNKKENVEEIEDWIQIDEAQNSTDKISFSIDSEAVENIDDLSNVNKAYLYIKEVAIKGGDQKIAYAGPMGFSTNLTEEQEKGELEQYISLFEYKPENKEDATAAPTILPYAGIQKIIIAITIIMTVGIIIFIRYKKLSRYV